jgi:site-specific DNA-adenine methylase
MNYPGGKNGSGVYQAIINLMPPHLTYIEPFLGSGAIMRLKKPAWSSIGIDIDAAVIKRFTVPIPELELIQEDALDWLSNYQFLTRTLIYLDPPYLMETRSSKRPIYDHEFYTLEQHTKLLELIQRLPCMVMISGYWSVLYSTELIAWRSASFQAQTRGGHSATEWVWMNYPSPLELHDYRYLGSDFRERERIKRKQARWKNRLATMPDLERHALLSVIESLRDPASTPTAMGSGKRN